MLCTVEAGRATQPDSAEPTSAASTGPVPTPPWILADAVYLSSWELPPVDETVGTARRLVTDACNQYGRADLAADAALLTSEVVTNAIRHSGGPVGLETGPHRGGIIVAVSDDSDILPAIRDVEPYGERGRGMHLVDAIAVEWGVERRSPETKTVWFHLTRV